MKFEMALVSVFQNEAKKCFMKFEMALVSEVLERIGRILSPLNLANMKSQKLIFVRKTARDNQKVLNFMHNLYWRIFYILLGKHDYLTIQCWLTVKETRAILRWSSCIILWPLNKVTFLNNKKQLIWKDLLGLFRLGQYQWTIGPIVRHSQLTEILINCISIWGVRKPIDLILPCFLAKTCPDFLVRLAGRSDYCKVGENM